MKTSKPVLFGSCGTFLLYIIFRLIGFTFFEIYISIILTYIAIMIAWYIGK